MEQHGATDRAAVSRWVADTWRSVEAMTHPTTGLPSDAVADSLDPETRSGYTSPTNIGGLIWSTVAARELGLITHEEARGLLTTTVGSVRQLDRHGAAGMFYNWYDEATGATLDVMPDGEPVRRFLSSVDNGWLAAGLMVAAAAEQAVALMAAEVLSGMDFGVFHDSTAAPGPGGLLRGGYWTEPAPGSVPGNHLGDDGELLHYTGHHYDSLVSEPRIASYIGIASDRIPAAHYFTMTRGPAGSATRTEHHLEVDVPQGAVGYRGMRLVPTWGGSMFEALMPDLFVPEAAWGPRSFGINHPLTVRAHREFGLADAGYGFWGFSPASKPGGGYSEWGVEPIGMAPGGYPSDLERTTVQQVSTGARWGDGVVTPHALFLALPYDPAGATECLSRIETELGAYGPGGFHDAVAVRSGLSAPRHLSLDQSMIMAAGGNLLADNCLRRYFCSDRVTAALRPLVSAESFAAGTETP